ncbi:MAG: Gfo/Idh/MocA family oxidoreductase, partial [Candidatus Omnitrophica bacterium]|nr:Gfo/Idh/MocA family oxidoreductase [Candidatus Omnitrophota bacterium]
MPESAAIARAKAGEAPPKRLLKVGIIGLGKMGRIRYETISKNGKAHVVAVADCAWARGGGSAGAGRRVPARAPLPGVRSYGRAEELLEDPEVEAVFIATPNAFNKPLTIAALRAGKHVFCEKPPAFCAADVEEVIAVERETRDLKLMYGFNHRHHERV